MKLSDLPEHLRAQAERQLARRPAQPVRAQPAETPRDAQKRPATPSAPSTRNLAPYRHGTRHRPSVRPFGAGMNKTEAAYQREILRGKGRYEPMTFHLLGGCRYTPDFLTIDDGIPTFHEVKGSYRLESEGRAWTAFNSAAAQYPFFRWIWAVRGKKRGAWSVKRRIDPADPSFDKIAESGDFANDLP